MIDVNKFENRIVKFKRISEAGEKESHAEITRIDYDTTSAVPRSVTARFVGPPLNAIMTLNYDNWRIFSTTATRSENYNISCRILPHF